MMVLANSLFYKHGNRITVGVSELLYDKIIEDPSLRSFFDGVDVDRLQEHMADLLGVITGGPDLYKGRDLRAVHGRFSITGADFDRLVDHMIASILEIGATEDEAQAIVKEIRDRRDEIVSA